MKQLLSNKLRVKTLWSSSTFKLDNDLSIFISERSLIKKNEYKISLHTVNPEPAHTETLNFSWLFLSLFCAFLAVITFFVPAFVEILNINIFSIPLFLFSILSLQLSFIKSKKGYKFQESTSNRNLFTIYEDSRSGTEDFMHELICGIEESTEITQTEKEFKLRTDKQYGYYISHLDALYNSGIIDENLYQRISSRVHRKVFRCNDEMQQETNIIYLSNADIESA